MKRTLAILALASAPAAVGAADWNPSAEFGLVITSGNSDTSNVNGKFAMKGEDEAWIHEYYALALRGEVEDEVTANRYEAGGKSGYKLSDRSYLFGSLRYENDDFAPFEYQATASLGYGWFAIRDTDTTLLFEIGPGYRRLEPVGGGDAEGEAIVRGYADFKHALTANTALYDTLLVEAGSDNTFAQNDLGVQVAMNKTLALKAGFQVRHNTDVGPGVDKTDTLTLVNLVWSPE
ncbi:MAG TPA: DUF481 domain-containing protein [Xanthomonadales bacterium]|nr:DUF481 domain-containing protein [Xanthomonadales bacterium]